jgi:3-phosphoshikimate 1-carboxyvinyltransferase
MIVVKCGNKAIRSEISLTPSKSITNRVLIIQALSENHFDIQNESNSNDSLVLKNILNDLTNDIIDAKDAGTAFRFLTAFLCIQEGEYYLTGSERMKKRPVGKLVEALQSLGSEIKYLERFNFPPLKITGKKLAGGKIIIDASESSQYVSALLLIAPKFSNGLEIELAGEVFSRPYISMTIFLMKYFGVEVFSENNKIIVPHGKYRARSIRIENDWSSASFWYLAAALSDSAEFCLKNLPINSIQGDSVIKDIMKQFNIDSIVSDDDIVIKRNFLKEIPAFFEYNFSACPDLVIPVAFTCAGLRIPAVFSGVKNLRIKESDRLIAIQAELLKAGCRVELFHDSFSIHPIQASYPISMFNSHNDHRMVMAEAMLSMVFNEVSIDDFSPVSKSYPEFRDHLKQAEFSLTVT